MSKFIKILFLLTAILLCLSLACACDSEADNSTDGTIPPSGDNTQGGDNPDDDKPSDNNPDDKPNDGTTESKSITVTVVGGTLNGGAASGTFAIGDTVTITAASANGFLCWKNSRGELISSEITYTFTVTEGSTSNTYTATYSPSFPTASFDDIVAQTVITTSTESSGEISFYHAQSTSGAEVKVIPDPRGEGNILSFSKTDTAKGDTVYFYPRGDGASCFVLDFDFLLDDTACSVPLQVNMGSCYRLQFEISQDHVLIYDAKTDGSEKHFLGGFAAFGEWIKIRVEYYPGDKTETGQYAKVFFNGTLAAISQNSASTTISSKFDSVRFYQLIASDAKIYLDNVSTYTTNDTFTDTDEDIIRILHGEQNNSDFENRFLVCEVLLGKETAEALRELCSIFDESFYIWLANLYDPGTGGFYYSNDARDFEGFLPDIESTSQAMGLIGSIGLGNVKNIYDDDMKARVVAWVQGLQAEDDGYFYHPQWGRDIGASRRGRDLGNCISVLNRFGASPLYPTALDRLSGGATPDASPDLTANLGTSRTVAVSKIIFASTTTTAPHLASEEAFIEYLDELFATVLSTSESGTAVSNSYSIGNTVASQASQIKAAGLSDACIAYFNAKQNPETGLWEADKNYRTVSGLLKISGLYNSLGAEIHYADKTVRSCIDVAASSEEPSAIVYVYNPLSGLSNVLSNLNKYSTADDAKEIRASVIAEMRARATELIENTHKKLLNFKKADGSFSYNISGAPANSQGEPVCFGANEGDVNGSALVNGTIRSLFTCMGISLPAYYSTADAEKFAELLKSRTPAIKHSVNDLKIDFESADSDTGLPKFVTAAAVSEGASYAIVTDTVNGNLSRVIALYSTPGKNDIISFKFPTTLTDAKCYSFVADLSIAPTEGNGTSTLLQLKIGSAYMLAFVYQKSSGLIKITDASSTGAGNKTTDLGISVNPGEWFNLRVDYYVGDASTVRAVVYINGKPCATSSNYYGSKIDGEPLPEPAKNVNNITAQSLMAAAIELKLDNVRITAVKDTLPQIIPNKRNFDNETEASVPSGFTNSISSGGSAEIAFSGDDGFYKIVSKSGKGDSTSINADLAIGDAEKYVFEAELYYVSSNNTTVTQLFLESGKGTCFAVDISYSGGLVNITERTSSGIGKSIIKGIDATRPFTLQIEYHPELSEAYITVKSGEKTITAATSAYHSEAARAAGFSYIRIYSLISAEIELRLDDMSIYRMIDVDG